MAHVGFLISIKDKALVGIAVKYKNRRSPKIAHILIILNGSGREEDFLNMRVVISFSWIL